MSNLSAAEKDQLDRARDLLAVLHAAVSAPPELRWERAEAGIGTLLMELDEILAAVEGSAHA